MSIEVDFGHSPIPFSFFTFSIMNTCYFHKHRNPLISFNNESTLTMCRTYFSASCGPDNCTRLAISCNDSVKKVWNSKAELITGRNYWENRFYSMCLGFYSITGQVLPTAAQNAFVVRGLDTDEPSGFGNHFPEQWLPEAQPLCLKGQARAVITAALFATAKGWNHL